VRREWVRLFPRKFSPLYSFPLCTTCFKLSER
jgi:hypothetical protein